MKYGLKEKGYKGSINLSISSFNKHLKIIIKDSGIGMDEKTMHKVDDMLNNYYEYKDFKNIYFYFNLDVNMFFSLNLVAKIKII